METEHRKKLLTLARQTLENELIGTNHDLSEFDIEAFQKPGGMFVTLTKNGELRGCIGRIESGLPAYENTIDLSKAAAFEDHRFSPVSAKELGTITIEISLLTVPEELSGDSTVDKIGRVRPGKDGVVLSAGGRRATFLPQVWESLPIKEDFLNELCRKAGLPKNYWQQNDMTVSTYQAEKFSEEN